MCGILILCHRIWQCFEFQRSGGFVYLCKPAYQTARRQILVLAVDNIPRPAVARTLLPIALAHLIAPMLRGYVCPTGRMVSSAYLIMAISPIKSITCQQNLVADPCFNVPSRRLLLWLALQSSPQINPLAEFNSFPILLVRIPNSSTYSPSRMRNPGCFAGVRRRLSFHSSGVIQTIAHLRAIELIGERSRISHCSVLFQRAVGERLMVERIHRRTLDSLNRFSRAVFAMNVRFTLPAFQSVKH